MIDIVVTWPKNIPLQRYLDGLADAVANNEVINYRIAKRPFWDFGVLRDRRPRLYRVHDEKIRGYTEINFVTRRMENEVRVVGSEDQYWPAGEYIVCHPAWHEIEPIEMKGFQGWRWFAEEEARKNA